MLINIFRKITPKICYLYLIHAIGNFIDDDLSDKAMKIIECNNVQLLITGCPLLDERQSLKDKENYLQKALHTINKYIYD